MPSYTEVVQADRPVYLQTKTYSAKDDRKPLADVITPGVVGTGDFLVSWTSGMGISIAAGIAYIAGQNVADQGNYRQYMATAATMTMGASDPTNPRIDQIILRVCDGDSDSSGAYEGRIEIIPGVATSGANLTNLTGAASLTTLADGSKSVLRLAYVLVPAAAVTIASADLKDARVPSSIGGNIPRANFSGGLTVGSAGITFADASVMTTASASAGKEIGYDQITSAVNQTATSAATANTLITCAAHTFDGSPVMVAFNSPFLDTNGVATLWMAIILSEGATVLGYLCRIYGTSTRIWAPGTGGFRFTPTAGSHSYTVGVFGSVSGGTVTAGPGGTNDMPSYVRFTKV